jgi:hypothetical protein
MIWRSECMFHAHDRGVVEVEFTRVPGPIALRVLDYGGVWAHPLFIAEGHAYFTSRNEIRCDSEWGPVVGVLDLEQRAVRMTFFPYQITIPDRWHVLEGEL